MNRYGIEAAAYLSKTSGQVGVKRLPRKRIRAGFSRRKSVATLKRKQKQIKPKQTNKQTPQQMELIIPNIQRGTKKEKKKGQEDRAIAAVRVGKSGDSFIPDLDVQCAELTENS